MADTIKTASALNIELSFVDGDTRTLSIDSPNEELNLGTAAASIGAYVKEKNLLIGDKTGADSKGIKGAKLVKQKTTHLDIT